MYRSIFIIISGARWYNYNHGANKTNNKFICWLCEFINAQAIGKHLRIKWALWRINKKWLQCGGGALPIFYRRDDYTAGFTHLYES